MRASHLSPKAPQSGIALIYALIALVVLLMGAAATLRAMNNGLLASGNYGFKRELANQSERALNLVLDRFVPTGALGTEALRQAHLQAQNYSASNLALNAQGMPLALLSDSAFELVGTSSNDITLTEQGLRIRYVVDRLCASDGVAGAGTCQLAGAQALPGGSGSELLRAEHASAGGAAALKPQPIYRVSLRVDGPRSSQSFFQSTFSL